MQDIRDQYVFATKTINGICGFAMPDFSMHQIVYILYNKASKIFFPYKTLMFFQLSGIYIQFTTN